MSSTKIVRRAAIKMGANQGAVVHIHQFDTASGKFFVDYPHSPAIGYFKACELFPLGDWHFKDDSTLADGLRLRPSFASGDPFALIPQSHFATKDAVLITTQSGHTTIAYPIKGHVVHDCVYQSEEYQEHLFAIPDGLFSDPALIKLSSPHTPGCASVIREMDVAAWCEMPVLVNA